MVTTKAVAIVTGGASGIGAALCRQMVKDHIFVVIADVDLPHAQRLRDEISADDGRVEAAFLDVSDRSGVSNLVTSSARKHGRLDYMVNNAAIIERGLAHELDWQKTLDVNLGGVIAGTMAAYSVMRKQGFGHIVNIASLGALCYAPLHLPYVTSKSAVLGFSIALRPEAQRYGVKVSAVCPGNIQTAMTMDATLSRFTPAISADRAASEILSGMRRNTGVMVFPFYAHLFWWIERVSPLVGSMLRQHIVKKSSV